MARQRPYLFAMNGGEVSPLAMARVDLQRMKISAEIMKNCIPRVIGPASFRPGLHYHNSTDGDGAARNIPFIFSAEDTALVELSDKKIRVRIDGDLISRASVSTVVTNGNFSASAGWTLTTTHNGVASISGNKLTLQTPTRGGSALAKRSDSVSAADQNIEHAIELSIDQGPVKFRCGSTDGGDEYIAETELKTGFFSLTFTPTSGTYYIQVSAESEAERVVSDISIASSGAMEIVSPWVEADLFDLRYDQSGDVIYFVDSGSGYMPRRIERRNTRSWALTEVPFTDGPFRGKTADLTLSPDSMHGNGTLTASEPFFQSGHVGCVFRLTHPATRLETSLAGDDQFTDTIEITGLRFSTYTGTQANTLARQVTITTTDGTATWVTGGAELAQQTSLDDGSTWSTVNKATANLSSAIRYPEDEGVVLFRIGFLPGDYVSGDVDVEVAYDGGGGDGYVLITSVTNSTSAEYEVISRLHNTGATDDWSEGAFSDVAGWPSAVGLFEGRLWYGSKDKIYGSASDALESFDLSIVGDSGPIIRSIATGPVNNVEWISGVARLVAGTSGSEAVGRSSSFDEPITPTNFSIKDASTQGSAKVEAIKIDKGLCYVQRSGKKLFEMFYSVENQDYVSGDLTRYHPTLLTAGVKVLAVQRQPDTRIWVVLNDGTVACLVYEKSEDVVSWFRVETDGLIEDVTVLPNTTDDDVYFIVNRTIDGTTKRYVESLDYEAQAQGGALNSMADAHIHATLSAGTSVTGLTHLEGKSVIVWANGEPIMDGDEPKTFTVSSGAITLESAVTGEVVAGLSYTGQWKSARLAYGVADDSPISRKKQIMEVAPILYKTHIRGLKYGQSFDSMDYLPLEYLSETQTTSKLYDEYDQEGVGLPGDWQTDARLHLEMQAPLPCTVQALSLVIEGH